MAKNYRKGKTIEGQNLNQILKFLWENKNRWFKEKPTIENIPNELGNLFGFFVKSKI